MKTDRLLPNNPSPFNINGCFIAGGAIHSIVTGTTINDFDIYPKSRKDFEDLLINLIEKENFSIVNISNKAVTLECINNLNEKYIAQIIFFKFYNTAEELFKTFDFTICMAAFDCDTFEYKFHPNFYQDVASKTLRYNENALYPVNSLLRVKKYSDKGYNLGKMCTIKLALSLMKRGLPSSWKELEEETGGLYGNELFSDYNADFSYENIINLLDSIDNNNISYINNNEHESETYEILNNNYKKEIEYIKINENLCVLTEDKKIKETVPVQFINNIGKRIKLKDISNDKDRKFFGYKTHEFKPLGDTGIEFIFETIYKNKQKVKENIHKGHCLYIVTFSIEGILSAFKDTIRCSVAKSVLEITSLDDSMDDDIQEAIACILSK